MISLDATKNESPELVTCPICGSDNWVGLPACHNCGYPFRDPVAEKGNPPATRSYRKRKRVRGNGMGSVTRIQGRNLARPWRVQVSVGYAIDEQTGEPKQLRKNLGMFATRQEAEAALSDYLANPFDLDAKRVTFAGVYSAWSRVKFPDLSPSRQAQLRSAYAICQPLYGLLFAQITPLQLQAVIDDAAESGKNYPMLSLVKQLYAAMFRFGMDNGIVSRDASSSVTIKRYQSQNPNAITRAVFSDSEIQALWDAAAKGDGDAEAALFLIHSGLRISEFFNLKRSDVQGDLISVTQSKTKSGVRSVVLPQKIMQIVQSRLAEGHEFLFTYGNGRRWLTDHFRKSLWLPLMARLGMSHTPHDTRHTYTSVLLEAGVPVPICDVLTGHKSNSVTLDVYAHYSVDTLRDAVNKAFS